MLRLVVFFLLNFASPVWSAIDAYPFPNEELAERYDNLIAELRCPQCLNTNLAGSDAMIAQDLRRETHRMVLEVIATPRFCFYARTLRRLYSLQSKD